MKITSILRYLLLSLGVLFFLSSCLIDTFSKTENLDTITGLELFDENGSPIGLWQQPNNRRGDNLIFPVPSSGIINLVAQRDATGNPINFQRVIIRNGSCCMEQKNEARDDVFTLDRISSFPVEDIDMGIDDFSFFQIDMTSFGEGFYKIFMQLENDSIFWQNVYIDPSSTNFSDFTFLDTVCE